MHPDLEQDQGIPMNDFETFLIWEQDFDFRGTLARDLPNFVTRKGALAASDSIPIAIEYIDDIAGVKIALALGYSCG